VKEWPKRASMFRELGNIINMRSKSNNDTWHHIRDEVWSMLQNFYQLFAEEEGFISYFKCEWEVKIGTYNLWVLIKSILINSCAPIHYNCNFFL
jgi:hypothetical protein